MEGGGLERTREEGQRVVAEKRGDLAARTRGKQLSGVEIIALLDGEEIPPLSRMYAAYCSYMCNDTVPTSRLPHSAPREQICAWVVATMGLQEGQEYFYLCGGGFWAHIRLTDVTLAVPSLLGECVEGFLLAEVDLSRMLEVGFDSRDEERYLIDIWNRTPPDHVEARSGGACLVGIYWK